MNLLEFARSSYSFKSYSPTIKAGDGTVSSHVTYAGYTNIGSLIFAYVQASFNTQLAQLSIGVTMPTRVRGNHGALPVGAFCGVVQGGLGNPVTTGMITLLTKDDSAGIDAIWVSKSDAKLIALGSGGAISGVFIYLNGSGSV